jgi:hypothetical protein
VYLLTDRIIPDRDQPRKSFDATEFQELVDSIAAFGILQPLIVRYDAEQDLFVLITGERRWRAATELGLPRVPVIVNPETLSEDERRARQLEENTKRADLKPGEILPALALLLGSRGRQWLREHGWKNESKLSRWATVAENELVPDPDQPGPPINLWDLAEQRGITAAYERISAIRQTARQERGRAPMGRPTGTVPTPAPAVTLAGGTPSASPAPLAAPIWQGEAAEAEDREEDADIPPPIGPPTVDALTKIAPPRATTPPPAARPVANRPSAPPLASELGAEPPWPGRDLGVIAVDGSLFRIPSARDLVARLQDSPDLDALRRLLGHTEYSRWIGQVAAEDAAGWEADLQALADFLEGTARLIRYSVQMPSTTNQE